MSEAPSPESQGCDDNQRALDLLWLGVSQRAMQTVGEASYNSWLRPLRPVALHDDQVVLLAPTGFLRDWISNNYRTLLEREFRVDIPHLREVVIDVGMDARLEAMASRKDGIADDGAPMKRTGKPVGTTNGNGSRPAPEAPSIIRPRDAEPEKGLVSVLDQNLTFDKFVVGKPNELAYAAARRVADADGVAFNPLFLYAGVGLGKTHLMHAIAWHIRQRRPDRKVLYLTAEMFMYHFIKAVRFRDTVSFKEKFRSVDVLMVDDLQFISGKESTQEEFFHTFNELIDRNHQIVVSADRSPSDLEGMEERVRSRLAWGLVADIHPTDFELRVGILEQKLALEPEVTVPREVVEFLAHRITSNVRELEGAMKRVIAYHALMGRAISLEMVQEVLADVLRANARKVSIDDIQRKVAEHYNIRMAEMSSARRARAVARPRQVAMFLAKRLTSRSLPEIGRKFGNRDHTTVLHGVRRIEELIQSDVSLAEDVRMLEAALSN
ncbi:MAG: chromosomal replication initiator protein DnaA [Minwuia sp.]|nr:chromosomal replication initiator protein DnaA [Minwuia sp.]